MEKIYIESTVPSYYCARLSNEKIKNIRQIKTREFWKHKLNLYDVYISDVVIQEISDGDPVAVIPRRNAILNFKILRITTEDIALSLKYVKLLGIPEKAYADTLHLAISCHNKIDYIVTWNFTHIANVDVISKFVKYNEKNGIHTPQICTPDFF